MSLINQMLQDLEARPAEGEAPGALQAQAVRAAALKPARDRWSPVLGALALAGFVATGYVAWQRWHASPPDKAPRAASGKGGELSPELSLRLDAALLPLADQPVALTQAAPVPLQPSPGAAAPSATAMPNRAASGAPGGVAAGAAAPDAASSRTLASPGAAAGAASQGLPAANAKSSIEPVTPREASTPEKAEAEFQRGQQLAREGSSEQAMAAWEKALTLAPAHVAARESLARALIEAKKPEQAMAQLREGLEKNRAASPLAMMLARLQLERGDTRGAIDTLARSLPYDQERPNYQAYMAGLLQKEGRHREAIDYYLAAVRRAPQNANWWMGMGMSLQADQRPDEAREAYQRALDLGSLGSELQAFVQQRMEQLR